MLYGPRFTHLAPLVGFLALAAHTVQAVPMEPRGEMHYVELINKCGSGQPLFFASNLPKQSSGVISGPIMGGVAWLSGSDFAPECTGSHNGCGTVEFTLVNPEEGVQYPMQNAINYSLLDGLDRHAHTPLGDHKYKYPMNFEFTGDTCHAKAPGQCLHHSKEQCPGAFVGDETEGGVPVMCQGANAGVSDTVTVPQKMIVTLSLTRLDQDHLLLKGSSSLEPIV